MREFHLYSEKKIQRTINEMFENFEIHSVSEEMVKKNNFKNQNIILIVNEGFLENLKESFFFNNNVVVFCLTNKNFNNKSFFDAKVFDKHTNISKIIDGVTTFFTGNLLNCGDVKILGERMINKETEKEVFLTILEKNILMSLAEQEQVKKDFLLEEVLKIKKDTETKTIESHLTRIRNKLSKISSKLKIISKGDRVFLER